MRRLLALALIALILYGVSQSPGPWADSVHALGGHLADAAHGFSVFFTDLTT